MIKIEYLQGLIERTDNWYHKHIYQTQLNRLLGKSPKIVLPTYIYSRDASGKTICEQA